MTITNSNKIRITLLAILIIALFTLSPILNVFAYATDTTVAFDDTNVLDDLKSSNNFNVEDYRENTLGVDEFSIINFVEYCYSPHANMRDNYGLYVYVYNPLGTEIDVEHNCNKIQIAVSYNNGIPNGYEKFDLKLCNYSTTDGLYRKLYKFKVVDHVSNVDDKTICERVQSSARRYDVSGIEIHKKGKLNATEYTIGGTYTFTGFAKGYGYNTNDESTLNCEVYELDTIFLDLAGTTDGVDKRTFWRSETSSLGKWHQNQINSVFFAIDNDVLRKYGNNLQKIKAEWWEYKTTPVLVVEDDTLYNTIYDYRYKKLSNPFVQDIDVPFFMYDEDHDLSSFITYNVDWFSDAQFDLTFDGFGENMRVLSLLPWVFKTPTNVNVNDYTLTAEAMQKYASEYTQNHPTSSDYIGVNSKNYSVDLFENDVDNGRTMGYNSRTFDADKDTWDILSYDDTHSWWDKFCDYGFFAPAMDDTYLNQKPIYALSDSDMASGNIANNLLINESDVDDLKAYYNKMKSTHTVFLFRYALTDYYAESVELWTSFDLFPRCFGEIRQGTEIFDFDILEMTFGREGNYTVIPVVSSPVDHLSDFTPAVNKGCQGVDIIGLLIGLLLVIVLFFILSPILPYIIKGIWWVITAPFKFIGWLIKACRGKDKGGTS